MRLELSSRAGIVVVRLSRRNLLALLAKLELPGSARMIEGGYSYLDGRLVGVRLLAVAEPDAAHYAEREPAGPMHRATEALLAGWQAGNGPAAGTGCR